MSGRGSWRSCGGWPREDVCGGCGSAGRGAVEVAGVDVAVVLVLCDEVVVEVVGVGPLAPRVSVVPADPVACETPVGVVVVRCGVVEVASVCVCVGVCAGGGVQL